MKKVTEQKQIYQASWRRVWPQQVFAMIPAVHMGIVAGRTIDAEIRLLCACGVLFCIWLIHCARPLVCTCLETELEVTLRPQNMAELLPFLVGCTKRLRVPYDSIVGVGADWRDIYLASAEGGMVDVPVLWHLLSAGERQLLLRRLAAERNEHGEDREK